MIEKKNSAMPIRNSEYGVGRALGRAIE